MFIYFSNASIKSYELIIFGIIMRKLNIWEPAADTSGPGTTTGYKD